MLVAMLIILLTNLAGAALPTMTVTSTLLTRTVSVCMLPIAALALNGLGIDASIAYNSLLAITLVFLTITFLLIMAGAVVLYPWKPMHSTKASAKFHAYLWRVFMRDISMLLSYLRILIILGAVVMSIVACCTLITLFLALEAFQSLLILVGQVYSLILPIMLLAFLALWRPWEDALFYVVHNMMPPEAPEEVPRQPKLVYLKLSAMIMPIVSLVVATIVWLVLGSIASTDSLAVTIVSYPLDLWSMLMTAWVGPIPEDAQADIKALLTLLCNPSWADVMQLVTFVLTRACRFAFVLVLVVTLIWVAGGFNPIIAHAGMELVSLVLTAWRRARVYPIILLVSLVMTAICGDTYVYAYAVSISDMHVSTLGLDMPIGTQALGSIVVEITTLVTVMMLMPSRLCQGVFLMPDYLTVDMAGPLVLADALHVDVMAWASTCGNIMMTVSTMLDDIKGVCAVLSMSLKRCAVAPPMFCEEAIPMYTPQCALNVNEHNEAILTSWVPPQPYTVDVDGVAYVPYVPTPSLDAGINALRGFYVDEKLPVSLRNFMTVHAHLLEPLTGATTVRAHDVVPAHLRTLTSSKVLTPRFSSAGIKPLQRTAGVYAFYHSVHTHGPDRLVQVGSTTSFASRLSQHYSLWREGGTLRIYTEYGVEGLSWACLGQVPHYANLYTDAGHSPSEEDHAVLLSMTQQHARSLEQALSSYTMPECYDVGRTIVTSHNNWAYGHVVQKDGKQVYWVCYGPAQKTPPAQQGWAPSLRKAAASLGLSHITVGTYINTMRLMNTEHWGPVLLTSPDQLPYTSPAEWPLISKERLPTTFDLNSLPKADTVYVVTPDHELTGLAYATAKEARHGLGLKQSVDVVTANINIQRLMLAPALGVAVKVYLVRRLSRPDKVVMTCEEDMSMSMTFDTMKIAAKEAEVSEGRLYKAVERLKPLKATGPDGKVRKYAVTRVPA